MNRTLSILLCLVISQADACNCSLDPCNAIFYRRDFAASCGENGTMPCQTAQISLSAEYTSDKAVDGNVKTCSKPVFSLGDSWWWKVDLHEFRTVEKLSLVFEHFQTADNFSIYINNLTHSGVLCTHQTTVPGENKAHVSCDKNGLVGRFVFIVFPQKNISLCELEVFETECHTYPQNMLVAEGHNALKDCYCPRGAYVADDTCQICPVGKITQSDCVSCNSCNQYDIGFVKNKHTSECEKCPDYTFNNFPVEERCFDCMSWTDGLQSCEKTKTNSTSCPNLCKAVPGFQVTGIGSQNLEPYPHGYFNNDMDQMVCRSTSTKSIGSVNSSQCTVCNFRYSGSKCQYCALGFRGGADGVCAKKNGVLIFLKVVLSIQGKTAETINSHIEHAFSARFNISNSLSVNMNRRNNHTIHITLEIQTEDAHADVLQRAIVNADMKAFKLYQGLATVNITVVSVDVFTKITPISHNTAILRYIVMLSICISTLIFLSVLCKFWFPPQAGAEKSSVLTLFTGAMRIKAKSYTPI